MRAVIAEISDDTAKCVTRALRAAGIVVGYICYDGRDAVNIVKTRCVDMLVISAALPGMGAAEVIETLSRTRLNARPAIIATYYPGMRPPTWERGTGATWLERPLSSLDIAAAVRETRVENRRIDSARREFLSDKLDKLGVPSHPGRDYIIDGAFLMYQDIRFAGKLTSRLYSAIERRAGIAGGAAERAMRHVIDVAWRKGNIDEQYEFFKSTIDAGRGKPTCGEMLTRLAVSMRMEDET